MRIKARQLVVILLGVALFATSLYSCDSQNTIPDKDLQKILTESILRQSVISYNKKANNVRNQKVDSTDYHSDILAKYGYSLDDYNNTITELARRKSNPLAGILNDVAVGIEKLALVAERRYKAERRFDTLSLNYYRDTLLIDDSLYNAPLEDVTMVVLDSLTRGEYTFNVFFLASINYLHAQHRMDIYFSDTSSNARSAEKNVWLSRSSEQRSITHTYTLEEGEYDSLVVKYRDVVSDYIKRRRVGQTYEADTSYVCRLEIVYTPLLADARERYYKTLFGENFPTYVPYMQRGYLNPKGAFSLYVPKIDTLKLDSLRLDSLRLDSLRLDSLRIDSLRLDSLRLDSLRLDSLKLDSLQNYEYKKDSSTTSSK